MVLNASCLLALVRQRHMNSHIYDSIMCRCVPLWRLLRSLAVFHNLSILCVFAPVFGSTKCNEWLTVWWVMPGSEPIVLYERHWSEMIVVPGRMFVDITGINVSFDLFGTGTMKQSLVSRHSPPNTHCCGRMRPT